MPHGNLIGDLKWNTVGDPSVRQSHAARGGAGVFPSDDEVTLEWVEWSLRLWGCDCRTSGTVAHAADEEAHGGGK